MKICFCCFIIIFTSNFFCQSYSQDYNSDSRALALGESLVASQSGIPSAENNPASIASYNKTTLLYSKRDFRINKGSNNHLYSTGAILSTPIGTFELLYKHYRNYDLVFSTTKQPEAGHTEIYDHTFNLSYATDISDDVSAGVTLKTCSVVASESKYLESNIPFLIDLGVIIKTDGFVQNDSNNEKLFLGLAVQNFGGKLREKYTFDSPYASTVEYSINIPRYLKLGFSYEFDINQNSSKIAKTIITCEYKNKLLNNTSNYGNYPIEFLGLGTEFTFYDIFNLRLGGILNSHDNPFGKKGEISFRAGCGLNLPFDLIFNNSPFSLAFDYSNVPVYGGLYFYSKDITDNLWAFNLNLTYNSSLF